jgi:hypothetical protein
MIDSTWQPTTQRFVAFFDILGFKDLVTKKSHTEILEKLKILKNVIEELKVPEKLPSLKGLNISADQTQAVTFSDSIIFFSKGDTFWDALKIFFDSYRILRKAIENQIAIKGCISFGEVTVDFTNSLFFGQPIIDAFLLHEDLEMLTVIFDNSAETKFNSFGEKDFFSKVLGTYKANLKSGKIQHSLMAPFDKQVKAEMEKYLNELYKTCYGRPRIYIDNTLEYLKSLVRI